MKNLTTTLALAFSLLSGVIAVVRWVDHLEQRVALVEYWQRYHGLDKTPEGD